MHVLFVEPRFPLNQRQFVRALHATGARVTGIGESPVSQLDPELKGWLYGYEQVTSVCDEQAMLDTVRRLQRRGWVDRLEATVEAHTLPTARVREATDIPGLSAQSANWCRDKPLMKQHLQQQGIPSALTIGASSAEEVTAFVKQVGYPVILKPRAAAGAAGTVRADNATELVAALAELGVGRGASVAVEEFVTGHEGFWDTLMVRGEVGHEFISHYYPNVLEAMRTRWISPQIVVTNRVEASSYDELKRLGRRVVKALELGTTATHMEWFFGPNGLRFSEIGARPPGVGHWDLYSAANEIDLYREWADAIVHRQVWGRPSRRYAAGIIALRPSQDGAITGYTGIDEIQQRFGPFIIDAHLPPPGSRTQPVEAGYMANAYVRARHPDYDTLREILDTIGQTVKVWAA